MLALVLLWVPAVVRADGDPASDVLAGQTLFLPQDSGITTGRQIQLEGLLTAANRRGYPIRAAVVATASDLGSVTALWRQPQNYARFLGQELSLAHNGTVLVVMPDGFGIYRTHGPTGVERAALARASPPAPGPALATAALSAIERLSAANGHPLTPPALQAPSGPASSHTLAWIVFGTGLAMIVLAWTASFRAQPPTLRRHGVSATQPTSET